MKKIICLLLIVAAALCLFVSCKGDTDETTTSSSSAGASYLDTVKAADMIEEIEKTVKPEGVNPFSSVSALAIKTYSGLKDILTGENKLTDDFTLRYTAAASFDEYGVLHFSTAEDVKKGEEAARTYLKSKAEDTLYRSYFPEEEYKLDESEVKVYGNYVVYGILSKENRAALFATVEKLLTE